MTPVRARSCDSSSEKCIPQGLISLASMHLTPSLSSFHFSADPDSALVLDLLNLSSATDDDNDVPSNDYVFNPVNTGSDDEDFGGFDDNGFGGGFDDPERLPDFDPSGGDAGEVDFFADQFSSSAAPGPSGGGAAAATVSGGGAGYGAVESFDPRRAGTGERDLVMAMDGTGAAIGGEEDTRGLFDYFDGKMGKNWAGPEHWKMRRNIKKGERARSQLDAYPWFRIDFADLAERQQLTRVAIRTRRPPRNRGRKRFHSRSTLTETRPSRKKNCFSLPPPSHRS